jgi:hypothetical protein
MRRPPRTSTGLSRLVLENHPNLPHPFPKGPLGRAGDLPISRKRVGKGAYQTRRRRRESDDPLLITGS